MAYMAFTVPQVQAQELARLYRDGDVSSPSDMHVTVVFLGKGTPTGDVLKAVAAAYSVAHTTRPFSVHAALMTSFPENPSYRDGFPVVVRVVSKELHDFQRRICAALDKFGVDYSRRFPDYKPHVTLSHGVVRVPPRKVSPISWTCSHMMIWGGDEHYSKIFAGVELSGLP